jgi:hypothetical protein
MNGTIGRCAEALGAIGGGAVAATAGIRGTHAAIGDQRSATAHNARTIHANLGYVRPEKRKVVRQHRPAENLAHV